MDIWIVVSQKNLLLNIGIYLYSLITNVVKGREKGEEKNIENESIIVSTSLITHAMKRVWKMCQQIDEKYCNTNKTSRGRKVSRHFRQALNNLQ